MTFYDMTDIDTILNSFARANTDKEREDIVQLEAILFCSMNDVQREVARAHRRSLYGDPFEGFRSFQNADYSKGNYYEGKIISRSEAD